MDRLRTILIGVILGCIGNLPSSAMDMQEVGTASVKLAGFLRICDIQLFSKGDYDWAFPDTNNALSLRIKYHRSISAERLVKMANIALIDEFSETVNESFQEQREAINRSYSDVKKGDVYELKYIPSKGLMLHLNQKKIADFNDDSFAQYYMKIWLGNNRLAESIVKQLKEQT